MASPPAKPSWASRPPRVGEIVTCIYPGDPKKRLRPVLVLETRAGSSGGFSVRVAYGTKNLNYQTRGAIDLIIDDQDDVDACGLPLPTRFDLETTITLDWEPPDFGCWVGFETPKIGELPMHCQIDCAFKLQAIQQRHGK